MKKISGLLKKVILICVVVYGVVNFVQQQKILNSYTANSRELDKQIADANQEQEKLNELKDNVNSDEYIEEMARGKLDMYLPNERVYINNQQ